MPFSARGPATLSLTQRTKPTSTSRSQLGPKKHSAAPTIARTPDESSSGEGEGSSSLELPAPDGDGDSDLSSLSDAAVDSDDEEPAQLVVTPSVLCVAVRPAPSLAPLPTPPTATALHRARSETPSTAESLAPVVRRKPTSRAHVVLSATGKKVPPAAAAKKAAKRKREREASSTGISFEVLIYAPAPSPPLVSHLSSPFAAPTSLRPLSILRTNAYASFLFVVPPKGVLSVGIGGEFIQRGAAAFVGGPRGNGLIVREGGCEWVGC